MTTNETDLIRRPDQRLSTAAHSWRDLLTYGNRTLAELTPYESDRDSLFFGGRALRRAVAEDPSIGGLLAWNRTKDEEGGHLIMFTGQTPGQERQVIDNASWLVSCGAVYAASRVGTDFKSARVEWKTRAGEDTFWVFRLSNDRNVDGMLR